MEYHGSAVLIATLAYHFHLGSGLAIGIFLAINLTATANLGTQIVAQRVNTAHTHAVQAARHLVGAFVKLATGMQHCHYDLEGRFFQFLMLVDGDTATIVFHDNGVVLGDSDVDSVAESCKCLVDRVIDNLANKMVQSFHACVANVHGGAFAHCL